MKKDIFLEQLQKDLGIESTILKEDTKLAELAEYTSLTKLGIIAFVDANFNLRLSNEQLNKLTDIKSLIDFIGSEKFD